ncbi:MAG: hypothetical protein COV31_01075 [Candidatus Yanofskybacteria bacterium CG10_big_fil_rev_8_21_14_0_10_46_23]|uniref:Phosphatidic acid phosphatase type 2/haloperoxidase domain-containing protein n=1 Tax=Candidatus Yanofskybacteria bacterium CG10_big_fil_rev_8_21_14_0_10_46_23 TaxID=1975098 RepID=A0A2H0R4P9_9BACT|nr:MAG: hypothetical protein COV31_01075 [Candidatus Yanofskybacteria bacterium CG10_big_fil_rev_8_21_14_0_10_46_23]
MFTAVQAIDLKLFHLLNGLAGQSFFMDWLIIFFASHLEYGLGIAFLVFAWLHGATFKQRIYVFGVTVVSVIVANFGITKVIRTFYHRPRPLEALSITHLLTRTDASFPSGHATVFFALAMAIYLHNRKWGVWFFVGAILISLGRVTAGIHYPLDILGGAVIGMAVAAFIFHLAKRKKLLLVNF